MQLSTIAFAPRTPMIARATLASLPTTLASSPDQVTLSSHKDKHGHHHPSDPTPAPGPAPKPDPSAPYYDAQADSKVRDAYYGELAQHLTSEDGKQLFDDLHSLVSRTHKGLPYAPETYLYPLVDRHPDNQIYSVYAGDGPMNLGDHNTGQVPAAFNCEHVVPQSWFAKRNPMRGDLHHLFACEDKCNSIRGNAPYTDLPDSGPGEEAILACGLSTHDRQHFEPQAGKGEVARAVLYFMLAYPGEVGDRPGEYTRKDLPLLQQWSRENPVTDYERHRNATIQTLQGNRNPLVDFPELADKIDFTCGLGSYGRQATEGLMQFHNSNG